MEARSKLPIYLVRKQLISQIKKCSSCIIIGETGSGKSTQVSQFISEAGINENSMIAVTEPRRVAAISLASRVANESQSQLGEKVGYSVRFDALHNDDTEILYMTDGMLLREALYDTLLKRFSVVILDEAHERTVHTDVLFGIVKRAQKERQIVSTQPLPPLKIIIMSATMNVDNFANYFDAPVLYIEGRLHTIDLFYMSRMDNDYVHNALVTIFQIHRDIEATGDILVFLTGQDEIESVQRKCRELMKDMPNDLLKMDVFGLYAALPVKGQMRVFEPTKPGHRKVILSTNIAETSLTIPGVRFVIDSGKVKSRVYEPIKRIDMLRVVKVSKSQAIQRTGRAGREAPGKCFRLYTEQLYENLNPESVPEIERCSLSSVVLELVSMGLKKVNSFDFMNKPKQEAVNTAISELKTLGAVDIVTSENTDEESELELTSIGQRLAAFPLEPKFSKILLAACDLYCLEEMLIIVAMMATENVMINYSQKREESQRAHSKFIAAEGDHLTMLNVFRSYRHAKNGANPSHNWCQLNFIHERGIQTVEQIRTQLRQICVKNGLEIVSCGDNMDFVRKALCHGLFMNTAELDPSGKNYRLLYSGLNAKIHPSSVLHGTFPRFIIFSELVMTNELFIRDATVVEAEWLKDAAPEFCRNNRFTG